jgi:hypothetical protein
MVGYFPSPYPDELLYSLCARFSTRVAYSGAKSTLQEIFGATTASAVIDLPNRLGYLATALPAGTSLTLDSLILRHTLFPFFSAFIQPERVRQLRKSMAISCGTATHMRSGVMASRISTPGYLRFCPKCKLEDEKYFGETYWHRLHQLPGVEICSSHQAFLQNSSVGLRASRKHLQFTSAEQATRAMEVRHVDIVNRDHRALLRLSRDAAWLLEQHSVGTAPSALYSRYLRLLIDQGLATYTGSIHVGKLLDEFKRFYSRALLKLLHCEFTGADQVKTNWLLRLVRKPKHAQHPLYHLLLIQFLGCTAEEFFRLPAELSFFGEGPWPCLNPAADHYRKLVIRECKPSSRLRDNRPVGTFSCECGFSYARSGPDSSAEDRFRVGRMISFGQVWEAKLKQLWKDSSLSLSEVGRRLGVDPLTVRRHAARLRLPFSRDGRNSRPLKCAAQLKGKFLSAAWEKKRRRCRSKWLSAMKPHRKSTLKALRHKLPREYAWLLQNDAKWLEKHKPRPMRRNLSTASIDWKRRDAEYAVAVRLAASRLKDAPGRPVWVTKTAIGRALGTITLLRQKLHNMPLTSQVLAGVVETREQYAVRRVWWAAEFYRQEGVMPLEWQLVARANVRSLREVSAVECAVKGAMSMLTSKLPQSRVERAASSRKERYCLRT